ncbi:MAG: DUF4328 domain-containing protein [Acidimicrobiia bacterium]
MTSSPTTHRTVSRGLTGTLRGFLYAAAAISLAAVFTVYSEAQAFEAWWNGTGSLERLTAAEEATLGIDGILTLASLTIIVLVVVWWYQAYLAIQRLEPSGLRWSPGWAIGGWFIPFANLVIPKRVLDEVDRVSFTAEDGSIDGWRERPTLRVAAVWWGFWVGAVALRGIGIVMTQSQLLPEATFDGGIYASGLRFSIVGLAALCVAALCGAAALRVLGERLGRQSARQ